MPKGLNDTGIKNVTKTHAKSSKKVAVFMAILPYFLWAIFAHLSLFLPQFNTLQKYFFTCLYCVWAYF